MPQIRMTCKHRYRLVGTFRNVSEVSGVHTFICRLCNDQIKRRTRELWYPVKIVPLTGQTIQHYRLWEACTVPIEELKAFIKRHDQSFIRLEKQPDGTWINKPFERWDKLPHMPGVRQLNER